MAYTAQDIQTYVNQLLAGGGGANDIVSAAKQYGVPLTEVAGAYGMNADQAFDYLGNGGVRSLDIGDFGMSADDWMAQNGYSRSMQTPVSPDGNPVLPGGYEWGGQLNWNDRLGQYTPFVEAMPGSSAWDRRRGGSQQQQPAAPAAPQPPAWASYMNYTPSPQMMGQWDALSTAFNDNLNRSILPSIRGEFRGVGGGGSRQGIAEGLAIGESQKGLASALAGLLGQDYQNAMQRGTNLYGIDTSRDTARYGIDTSAETQKYGIDKNFDLGMFNGTNSYNLGLGQLGLGYQNSMFNYDLGSRSADNADRITGMNMIGLGTQLPWTGLNNYGNLLNGAAGNNVTVNTSGSTGGGLQGAFGGALSGAALGGRLGWWG